MIYFNILPDKKRAGNDVIEADTHFKKNVGDLLTNILVQRMK